MTDKQPTTIGHFLVQRGLERFEAYCGEKKQRAHPKSLADFYAEEFTRALLIILGQHAGADVRQAEDAIRSG